jgi:hypothetical protein
MARLDQMPEPMRSHLAKLPCPSFENHPWVFGLALSARRVALISAAGRILRSVKERCLKEADESLRKTGVMLLVPLDQA